MSKNIIVVHCKRFIRKSFSLFVFLFFILNIISVDGKTATPIEEVELIFNIQADLSVQQIITYTFTEFIISEDVQYVVAEEPRNVQILANEKMLEPIILEEGEKYIIKVSITEPTKELKISFTTKEAVFQSNDINHFFTHLSLPPNIPMRATIQLPYGHEIYKNSFLPTGGKTSSDGRIILLQWDELQTSEDLLFSFNFKENKSQGNIWLLFLLAALFTTGGIYVYFQNQSGKALLQGFHDGEQKTITYIQHHKSILQKDLEREFCFSRVKATRIVKKLVEKGLVSKESFGRTNKLNWIK